IFDGEARARRLDLLDAALIGRQLLRRWPFRSDDERDRDHDDGENERQPHENQDRNVLGHYGRPPASSVTSRVRGARAYVICCAHTFGYGSTVWGGCQTAEV